VLALLARLFEIGVFPVAVQHDLPDLPDRPMVAG
jgi:hypothetical protein